MRERTFTEVARRDQIVRAAIATLAEVGYAKTSLGKIARTAGLSSVGMISYYFDGKAELMSEVVATVLAGAEAEVGPRVREAPGRLAALRAYIEASLSYIAGHPAEMAALFEISSGQRKQEESYGENIEAAGVQIVADLVAGAQAELGTPDALDPHVVAVAVRGAIHMALAQRMHEPADVSRPKARRDDDIGACRDDDMGACRDDDVGACRDDDVGARIADLFERSLRFVPPAGDPR
ncbi:hypothetical protein AWN90_18385 [Nocardia terpenica]|uniref:HTH tetR-type domain-containing protein n=1 Tax=Nocardia terpenica TaxID=455432 RepID=A0A164PBP4_9NOCA|nr:hypothetical protein AWN90_18385 [Nocardia terpenica]